jgi:hypothetical protein
MSGQTYSPPNPTSKPDFVRELPQIDPEAVMMNEGEPPAGFINFDDSKVITMTRIELQLTEPFVGSERDKERSKKLLRDAQKLISGLKQEDYEDLSLYGAAVKVVEKTKERCDEAERDGRYGPGHPVHAMMQYQLKVAEYAEKQVKEEHVEHSRYLSMHDDNYWTARQELDAWDYAHEDYLYAYDSDDPSSIDDTLEQERLSLFSAIIDYDPHTFVIYDHNDRMRRLQGRRGWQ